MSEAEKRELQELISLLYGNNISQYGKRCLVQYIDKLQKENQELKEELDYYKQKESQVFDERDYYEE